MAQESELLGVRSVFHRPHPEKEIDKGAVKSVRRFLLEAFHLSNDFAITPNCKPGGKLPSSLMRLISAASIGKFNFSANA